MKKEYCLLFLDDIVSNAFIELNCRSEERIKKLSSEVIMKYGQEVLEKLNNQGKWVAFCLSKEATEKFRIQHRRYFTFKEDDLSVVLNDGIDINELIVRFRTYLPLDQLLAYMDKKKKKKGLLEPLNLLKTENIIQKKLGTK